MDHSNLPKYELGGYRAWVISDCVGEATGVRLTTILTRYPEMAHQDHIRHREKSFSVASNRAMRRRIIDVVREEPAYPAYWGMERGGMQAGAELPIHLSVEAKRLWDEHREFSIKTWERLQALNRNMDGPAVGLHKQWCNRLFYPHKWTEVLETATQYQNYWTQRPQPAAQPELALVSSLACMAYHASTPRIVPVGGWAHPFVTETEFAELGWRTGCEVSAARCARVSYGNQFAQYTYGEDTFLYHRLANGRPLHGSPMEHQARSMPSYTREEWDFSVAEEDLTEMDRAYSRRVFGLPAQRRIEQQKYGNLRGWLQFRKLHPGETAISFDYEDWLTDSTMPAELIAQARTEYHLALERRNTE